VNKRWYTAWTSIIIFALLALLARPAGDFPLNDDWTYAKSLLKLEKEGVIDLGTSSSALVTQLFYGLLFILVMYIKAPGQIGRFTVFKENKCIVCCFNAINLAGYLHRQMFIGWHLIWITTDGGYRFKDMRSLLVLANQSQLTLDLNYGKFFLTAGN